jgi:hypothetical protein
VGPCATAALRFHFMKQPQYFQRGLYASQREGDFSTVPNRKVSHWNELPRTWRNCWATVALPQTKT